MRFESSTQRIWPCLYGLLISLLLLVFIFMNYIVQHDPFRRVRYSTGSAENILGQYGLSSIVGRQNLKWNWVIVEGFDLRYWRHTTDSNIYISYTVAPPDLETEVRSWRERSISDEAVPWESTSKPFVHAPEWWPKSEVSFLTVVRIANANTAVVYLNKPQQRFFVFVGLLP
jgi:hypothetical protein